MTTTNFERNLEDLTIIWLDATLMYKHFADYVVKELYHLRRYINYFKLFIDCDSCIKYMMNLQIQNEYIFLVVSGSLGEDFLPQIHSTITQLYSIYIFCSYVEKHQKWAKNFSKIKGVYKDIISICQQLREDTIQSANYLTNLNISSTKEEALFNYNQLLKELQSIDNEESKVNFINECQCQYVDNEYQLEIINKFDRDYRPDRAIYWYEQTDIFLHRILTKALRTQDMSVLVNKLAFFLKDLHEQQQQRCAEKLYPIKVYRGLSILAEVFDKFEEKKYLYVPKILSANINLNIERHFSIQPSSNLSRISILLQIETMVADTSQEQVVFPIDTVFLIQKIEMLDHTGIQMVQLSTLSK